MVLQPNHNNLQSFVLIHHLNKALLFFFEFIGIEM